MIRIIRQFLSRNIYELITVFFIFTNLFPKWFPQFVYYISFFMILCKEFVYNRSMHKGAYLFIVFGGLIWFSSTINSVLDLRLVLFTFILYMSCPSNSLRWHQYKLKLLFCIFLGFGLSTLANFYAKIVGINQIEVDEYMLAMGRVGEFSGFANFAMWTSCAGAMSTLFFVSMAFRKSLQNKILKIICYAMILVSLYITMISASRSAFFLSLACSLLIIKMQSRKVTILIRNLIIIGCTALCFAPVLIDNAGAMLNKKNGLEITVENTSRDALWAQRMEEFQSSPIWGVGFAAHGVGDNKQVGRNESGGSFISVLAQAGIVGFIIVILIWIAAIMMPKKIGNNPDLILIYAGFIFMSIHSIIEGYMFQAGWYMCLVIWLSVGVMIEHKTLSKRYPQLMLPINMTYNNG